MHNPGNEHIFFWVWAAWERSVGKKKMQCMSQAGVKQGFEDERNRKSAPNVQGPPMPIEIPERV